MFLASTIIIPAFGHPNILHATLHGLVKNSFYRHRILLVMSDPRVIYPAIGDLVRDADLDVATVGFGQVIYRSVWDMLSAHSEWMRDHDVEVIDATAAALAMRQSLPGADEVINGRRKADYAEIALKNNIGIERATTTLVVPNWDDDFYPGLHWDRPLVECARIFGNVKQCYIPTHVQPFFAGDARLEDWKKNVVGLVTDRVVAGHPTVSEDAFSRFAAQRTRTECFTEPCGQRHRLHFLPMMLHTEHARSVGGYRLMGDGFDVDFDDRLRDAGFVKMGFADSFVIHKAFPSIEKGVCSCP